MSDSVFVLPDCVSECDEKALSCDGDGTKNSEPVIPNDVPLSSDFDDVHAIVVKELLEHKEVWVGETADPKLVLERFKSIQVPEMHLIHGSVVAKLGHVPRSSDVDENGQPYWVTLEHLVDTWKPHDDLKDFKLTFLSHRWSGWGVFDDEQNTKAAAISRISEYNKDCYGWDLYWWVDWTCANQDDTAGHIASLPLYIAASSQLFSVYAGSDYDGRGWISVERALSAALNSPRAWKYFPPANFDPNGVKDEWWVLQDPAEMAVSVEGDRRYLQALSNVAKTSWPVAYDVNWHANDNDYIDWGYQRDLEYGVTKIFTWNINHNMGDEN